MGPIYTFFPFLVSCLLALTLTPLVRRLAIGLNCWDQPVDRSVHSNPVPFLGGLAIYGAFAVTAALFLDLNEPTVQGLLIGGAFIVLLGVVDDLFRLPAWAKLVGQIVGALILVSYGIQIDRLSNPWGGFVYFNHWSIPFTVLWVVAFTNSLNFIDGLDGLAAGVAVIASVSLLTVGIQTGQPVIAVYLTALVGGAALGFLPYNFNPAKIFMGDAGAMFLGFALATISVAGTLKSTAAIALGIPVLALGLPLMDALFAVVRRYRNGQAIYKPDRGHVHHRLLQLGLNQREVVLLMYGISGWMGISAMALANLRLGPGLGVIMFAFISFYFGAKKFGVLDGERREHTR